MPSPGERRGDSAPGCATGGAPPVAAPDDFEEYAERLRRNLAEPGRFPALQGMMLGPSRRGIEERLARVRAPALVLMGTKDSDFKDPGAEARLVAERVRGDVELIEGAGHYPQVEFPDETADLIVRFARTSLSADAG